MVKTVMLFEETDNPYEKTFIGAKILIDRLYVSATTVDSDGACSLTYSVDSENMEKLAALLGVDKSRLLPRIGEVFRGSNADGSFVAFCKKNGIPYCLYAS